VQTFNDASEPSIYTSSSLAYDSIQTLMLEACHFIHLSELQLGSVARYQGNALESGKEGRMNKFVFLACPLSGIILLRFIALSRRTNAQIVLANRDIHQQQLVFHMIREAQRLLSVDFNEF
jgi:hypothetical protein